MTERTLRVQEGVEPYHQRHARNLLDFLYDKGFIADEVARGSLDLLEDYIAWELQATAQGAVRGERLSKTIREFQARPQRPGAPIREGEGESSAS